MALVDLESLREGDIEILGRMPYSSNGTFLVEICGVSSDHGPGQAIYKPARGERPRLECCCAGPLAASRALTSVGRAGSVPPANACTPCADAPLVL